MGVKSPANFDQQEFVIMELPYTSTIKALFNIDSEGAQNINLPSFLSPFFSNPFLETTSTGYFNFGFLLSQNTSNNQSFSNFLTQVDAGISAIKKPNAVNLVQDAMNMFIDHVGDVNLYIMTSDLTQDGLLQDYSFIDLIGVKNTLNTVDVMYSSVEDYLNVLNFGVQACITGGADAKADLQFVMTSLNIVLQGLPVLAPSLNSNLFYFWISKGVSIATAVVDPDGATIIPSYYDSSGSFVLGYDPTTKNIIYVSSSGMFIPAGDDYITLLNENNTNSMTYTTILNAIGGTGLVPYTVQISGSNQVGSNAGYTGILPGGSVISIPIAASSSGNVSQQEYLDPTLTINQNNNALSVIAKGTLNNGSSIPISSAVLNISGTQYTMSQTDSSTFSLTVDISNVSLPSTFSVYMVSPDVPGGFASGTIKATTNLVFTTVSKSIVAGSVSNLMTVQTQDLQGNPITDRANIDINLSSSINSGRFDISPNGPFDGTITQLTIPSGSSSTSFYYKDNVGGTSIITATGESLNSGNVTQPVSPVWDVNLDHVCNVLDLIMVGNCIGESGTVGWIPQDVNQDGTINVLDLITVGNNLGLTWQ